jgi:hypothetical protein
VDSLAAVGPGDPVQQHRLLCLVGITYTDPDAAGLVDRRSGGGQQRVVDAVADHQFLRLGRERVGLGVVLGGFGLGEQAADALEDLRIESAGSGVAYASHLAGKRTEHANERQAIQRLGQQDDRADHNSTAHVHPLGPSVDEAGGVPRRLISIQSGQLIGKALVHSGGCEGGEMGRHAVRRDGQHQIAVLEEAS